MTTNENTITKTFPTSLVEALESKVKTINRVAKRNGFPLAEITYGDKSTIYFLETRHSSYKEVERFESKQAFDDFQKTLDDNSTMAKYCGDKYNLKTCEGVEVTLTTTVIGFDGYRIVGVTENIDGIHTLNTLEEKFDFTKDRGTTCCDHCNVKRDRNKVLFLADMDDNVKRLGSTCVNLFFPKEVNPLRAYDFDGIVETLVKSFDEDDFGSFGSTKTDCLDTLAVIKHALYSTHHRGYVSVAKARNNPTLTTTKEHVLFLLSADDKEIDRDELESFIKNNEVKAQEILDWAKTQEGEYFDTVKQIIDAGYTPFRLIGYIVGILGWFYASETRKAVRDASKSEWIGDVGIKSNITGIVKSVKGFEGCYGQSWITTLQCGENIITYFNAFKVRGENKYAEIGDTVECVATIKQHTTFNDLKQTVIKRPSKIRID